MLTAATLVLAFAASATYDGWRLHEQLEASNDRELGNMTRALAESASQSLSALDALMHDTELWYEQSGRFATPAQRQAMFAARIAGANQIDLFFITDEKGMQTV